MIFSQSALAKDLVYFVPIHGHIHKNASKYSSSLTTISCGFPLKVSEAKQILPTAWKYVKGGNHFGYVRDEYVSKKPVECFQEKYKKFYNMVNLNLNQLYYWGRLYDQYIQSEIGIP